MKPRHTAEQSTVKVNKAEDIAAASAVGVGPSPSGSPQPQAAAPARRGFGGLAPKAGA